MQGSIFWVKSQNTGQAGDERTNWFVGTAALHIINADRISTFNDRLTEQAGRLRSVTASLQQEISTYFIFLSVELQPIKNKVNLSWI